MSDQEEKPQKEEHVEVPERVPTEDLRKLLAKLRKDKRHVVES